jgi:hypothetical protein
MYKGKGTGMAREGRKRGTKKKQHAGTSKRQLQKRG